jgi:acetolactate synthase-1/2/3 large subunit
MVVITGQVATPLMGTDAFQEVDIVGMTLPVVKHSFLVRYPERLEATVRAAFRLAREGRPGPVLIDLPKDVAAAVLGEPAEVSERQFTPRSAMPASEEAFEPAHDLTAELEAALALWDDASKPLLYLGGGIALAGDTAVAATRALVEATEAPAVATLKGLGVLPTDHPQLLGMLGMHGTKAANLAVQECDLLLCVGARFDDRATGKLDGFAPHARVVHLDADPAELGKLRPTDVRVHVNAAHPLAEVVTRLREGTQARALTARRWHTWSDRCRTWTHEFKTRYDAPGDGVHGPRLLHTLGAMLEGEGVVTCDVGQHQMWVAQHMHHAHPRRHLTSGGLGTMGFGLPAAIGAALGAPDRTVVCVSGDGSIMMNIQELATAMRYHLPVKVVLLDNGVLGMVRQWQELFFERRFSEVTLDDNPDFAEVARAFGFAARSLTHADDERDALQWLLDHDGPALLHVSIDPQQNVWPLVPPNATNDQMMEG